MPCRSKGPSDRELLTTLIKNMLNQNKNIQESYSKQLEMSHKNTQNLAANNKRLTDTVLALSTQVINLSNDALGIHVVPSNTFKTIDKKLSISNKESSTYQDNLNVANEDLLSTSSDEKNKNSELHSIIEKKSDLVNSVNQENKAKLKGLHEVADKPVLNNDLDKKYGNLKDNSDSNNNTDNIEISSSSIYEVKAESVSNIILIDNFKDNRVLDENSDNKKPNSSSELEVKIESISKVVQTDSLQQVFMSAKCLDEAIPLILEKNFGEDRYEFYSKNTDLKNFFENTVSSINIYNLAKYVDILKTLELKMVTLDMFKDSAKNIERDITCCNRFGSTLIDMKFTAKDIIPVMQVNKNQTMNTINIPKGPTIIKFVINDSAQIAEDIKIISDEYLNIFVVVPEGLNVSKDSLGIVKNSNVKIIKSNITDEELNNLASKFISQIKNDYDQFLNQN